MTDTGLPDVKVGDNLIYVTSSKYRSGGPVTVSRIGRKYLYVTRDGRELSERFDRATGVEDSGYGAKGQLYTTERHEERTHRASLYEQLREAGIEFRHGVRSDLTADQLRRLLAVVTPEEDA